MLCILLQISTEEIRQMEKDEAWEPTTRIPVVDEDILEVHLYTTNHIALCSNP